MPKREDIQKILIIGSGPIIIGQACEFDYSGTQACKALKEEGFEVILVNSNPATIMTDPQIADKTYIEPITPEIVEKIIAAERPDAILPTLGGQTGLNTAMELSENGVLRRYNVELIGANEKAIKKAEDRSEFKAAIASLGLDLPKSAFAYNLDEAWEIANEIGFPLIIRPSFTMGGTGGGIVHDESDFERAAQYGLHSSRVNEILIEESIIGWKEYEVEIMRDKADNVVIICSIENLDPMGIHTGDSITVAPAQTLTDRQYQQMRDAAIAIIREIGVETGGSNVQFAVNPQSGRMVVIEMNPRVSRSSALASKATGFPIAKFATKLAIGYTLDEIPNDITRETPASFEPAIDYCVIKIPRFTFEKFPEADPTLGIQMKSVGETMAIGRTFKEALQKGLRGLEMGKKGFEAAKEGETEQLLERLTLPRADRLFLIRKALDSQISVEKIADATGIDPWFIHNMKDIVDFEAKITPELLNATTNKKHEIIRKAKKLGFSDAQLADLLKVEELQVRALRKELGIIPTYKLVDTCAAEFKAYTPYYYSTYEWEDESVATDNKKIVILGGGPNRIGQGIEFDYCCCQASFALKELGIESIMVNSNPETVSTDYDTSDKLYFEPLTFEDVMNIIDKEKPSGVIIQFGGQTPLNLALKLMQAGAPIIGTSVESIQRAEDRDEFAALLRKIDVSQPPNGIAQSTKEALSIAESIGYPVLLRPSYVLGGRAMKIVYDHQELKSFIVEAQTVGENRPVLIDKFIGDAIEVDVDAISDSKSTMICGIMEHIEEAGIHSGDSACVLPPHTLSPRIISEIRRITVEIATELKVIGLLNIQFAVKEDLVYVLEVNPRASRTVPFVSKAVGVPWAKIAAKVMGGQKLSQIEEAQEKQIDYYAVKESVLPFNKFRGADIILGPEMKSTGEVMGLDKDFGLAFAKSQEAAGNKLPRRGSVFISVKNSMRRNIIFMVKSVAAMGFKIYASEGTWRVLSSNGINAKMIPKIGEGKPDIVDLIKGGDVDFIINVPAGRKSQIDSKPIRSAAISQGIPYITTLEGAQAAISGIDSLERTGFSVKSLQRYDESGSGSRVDSKRFVESRRLMWS
ncbi:carbamoyl-phosphate synthase large subunit [Chitinispirillales bacterium ANBcel5]|uniref:carbamoyl-phosphate synthase large subunit n=1 Tax=Cellulosispirillum alkaliphilum TaxID=3039283 RepID=UPI002A4E7BA3|nr:carbamoyl-phosphate synthase large subunit [Chitinispirillales bacterium ANBcel5]